MLSCGVKIQRPLRGVFRLFPRLSLSVMQIFGSVGSFTLLPISLFFPTLDLFFFFPISAGLLLFSLLPDSLELEPFRLGGHSLSSKI